jgi:aminoglycoside phosphotransferase (APT) family kinase protein
MGEQDWRDWIESETSCVVRSMQRFGSGASRGIWQIELDRACAQGFSELVLRCDTGDGPLSGSELDLAREAVIYRALRDTPVRIPRLIASAPDRLLMERASGEDAFAAITQPSRREAVASDYLRALAELHVIDPDKLRLPGIAMPSDGPSHARVDLGMWRRIHRQHPAKLDPLFDFAFDWLDASAPRTPTRTSLCHGDAGPGNFLFDGERVSALIDWEFAHVGDPLDDLAWISIRGHLLGGFGDVPGHIAAWSQQTGLPTRSEIIEFYRAMVLLRMGVSCQRALEHAGESANASELDVTLYELLLPYLRFLLPGALELAGCKDPALAGFAREGEAVVEANPVLSAHATPLVALKLQ